MRTACHRGMIRRRRERERERERKRERERRIANDRERRRRRRREKGTRLYLVLLHEVESTTIKKAATKQASRQKRLAKNFGKP